MFRLNMIWIDIKKMTTLDLTPGFDGIYGWLTILEADVIFSQRLTWSELGYDLLKEVTHQDGTIFVLLQKKQSNIAM